jgi:hypothetical protein
MAHLIPAYGRDYKSKGDLLRSIAKGEDFIVADMSDPGDGKPCTPMQDYPAGTVHQFRYCGLTKFTFLEVGKALPKPKPLPKPKVKWTGTITVRQFKSARSANKGYCRDCGAPRAHCEPDATDYHCESCGHDSVQGAEEYLFNDWIR